MLPRRRLLSIVAFPIVLVAACGNSRTEVSGPSTAAAPAGFHDYSTTRGAVAFRIPNNWTVVRSNAPLIVLISSGPSTVALWRYPLRRPPPASLPLARAQLIAAARARDHSFEMIRSSVFTIDRAGAVELDAIEQIGAARRRVRSLHVFTRGGEVVLDEYAPVAQFHAVDHAVFSPLKHSLRLLPATG